MRIRKLICTALAFLLFLPLLAACGGGTPTPGGTPRETTDGETTKSAVLRDNRILQCGKPLTCGDILFTCFSFTMYRYNTVTNTYRTACIDPECAGDCALESGRCLPLQVVDRKLYFWSEMPYQIVNNVEHTVVLGVQDLVTGEVKILLESTNTQAPGGRAFVYDGMLYYSRRLPKEDADTDDPMSALDPDNYEVYICRVPIGGGAEEALRPSRGETLFVAADGYFLMWSAEELCLYSYDADFRERTLFLDLGALGYTSTSANPTLVSRYMDGKEYFHLRRGEEAVLCYCSLDLASGELTPLVQNASCHLAEDAIYYHPQEERLLYKPEGWDEMTEEEKDHSTENGDYPVYSYMSAELYACDLDGQNVRLVGTLPDTVRLDEYAVVNGAICGWMYDFDKTTHKWSKVFLGSIDFAAGTVTRAVYDAD